MFVCLRTKGIEFHETKHSPQTSQQIPMVAASNRRNNFPSWMHENIKRTALKTLDLRRQQVKKLIKVIFMRFSF
jgi:hypothetical protein